MRAPTARRRPTVVVEFSRGSIRLAAAESAGEAVRFRGMTEVRLPTRDGEVFDDDELVGRIGEEVVRHGWRGLRAACLLSRSATSTQSFLFPAMRDAELRQAIALKLRETLHFSLEEAFFDFRRLRERTVGGNRQTLTLVAAARRDAVRHAAQTLRQAGLRPESVGCASESLAHLTYYASPCDSEDATLHVDVGSASTIVNLFEGRLLRFSREIDTAGDAFTRALMRPIITPSGAVRLRYEQAEELRDAAGYPREEDDASLPFGVHSSEVLPLLEPVAQRLVSELQQSADYLCGILGRPRIDYVVLSGEATRINNLSALIEESLEVPVVSIDPVARAIAHWRLAICGNAPSDPGGFSAILGYSLGAERPINLLPSRRRRGRAHGRAPIRVGRAVAAPALAVGTCLSLAAVPIQRRYGAANEALLAVSERLDARLSAQAGAADAVQAARATARRVATARGAVPAWGTILMELSALVPADARVVSLSMEREDGAPTLRMRVRMPGPAAMRMERTAALVVALGTSPFFRDVRLVEPRGEAADAEIELGLLAPDPDWRSAR
ncbi:MAG: pilus assembly protein PilM [Planctomycetota bacterium]